MPTTRHPAVIPPDTGQLYQNTRPRLASLGLLKTHRTSAIQTDRCVCVYVCMCVCVYVCMCVCVYVCVVCLTRLEHQCGRHAACPFEGGSRVTVSSAFPFLGLNRCCVTLLHSLLGILQVEILSPAFLYRPQKIPHKRRSFPPLSLWFLWA